LLNALLLYAVVNFHFLPLEVVVVSGGLLVGAVVVVLHRRNQSKVSQ